MAKAQKITIEKLAEMVKEGFQETATQTSLEDFQGEVGTKLNEIGTRLDRIEHLLIRALENRIERLEDKMKTVEVSLMRKK